MPKIDSGLTLPLEIWDTIIRINPDPKLARVSKYTKKILMELVENNFSVIGKRLKLNPTDPTDLKKIQSLYKKIIKIGFSVMQLEADAEHFFKTTHNNQQLTSLEMLDLKLHYLIPEVGDLTHLVTLDLEGNRLKYLPDQLVNLPHLINLDLSNNKLEEVPPVVVKLIRLKTLDLSKNKLSNIPKSIGCLSNLSELNLHDNKLTTLPPSIGNLKHLLWLELYDNPIEYLPKEVGSFRKRTFHFTAFGYEAISGQAAYERFLPPLSGTPKPVCAVL